MRLMRLWLIVAVTSVCGCGLDHLTDKLDEAIKEIAEMRKAAVRGFEDFNKQIVSLEESIASDVSTILARDLIQATGQETRCTIDYVETKILLYLQELEDELKTQRELIKTGKSTVPQEQAIKSVLERVGRVPPHVCSITPATIKYKHANNYGQSMKLREPQETAAISGFSFDREPSEFQIRIVGKGQDRSKGRIIANGHQLLTVNTSYQMTVKLKDLASHLKEGDREVSIYWQRPKRTNTEATPAPEFLFSGTLAIDTPPPEPPPVPRQQLTIKGTLHLLDEELVDDEKRAFEINLGPYSVARNGSFSKPNAIVGKVGGEVRGEVDFIANAEHDGKVKVAFDMRLFEGTSANTTDLDGKGTLTFYVGSDASVSDSKQVNSEEASSDDYMILKVTVGNKRAAGR